MGKIINNTYVLTEDELDALAEKNSNATLDPAAVKYAKTIQARIETAEALNKRDDKLLPRYYDYTANGKLKRKRK